LHHSFLSREERGGGSSPLLGSFDVLVVPFFFITIGVDFTFLSLSLPQWVFFI
jgi:hypothetical protein